MRGTVQDAGGGLVTVLVDRDTLSYPRTGDVVEVRPAHDGEALLQLVNRWPEGTELESLCPECLQRGEWVIDKIWCRHCAVERSEWIRVVWRRHR